MHIIGVFSVDFIGVFIIFYLSGFIPVDVIHVFTGQVGLGVGSWTSNLTNAGSIPGEFDYTL